MKAVLTLFISLALSVIHFKSSAQPKALSGEKIAPQYKEAVIKDYSALGEGCEWLIGIDGKLFRPKNLQDAFKKDGLHVNLDIEFALTLFKCPEMDESVQEVSITWIEAVPLKKPSEQLKIKSDLKK